jgi:Calcium binding
MGRPDTTKTKAVRPSRRAGPPAKERARGRPTRDADREERITMQVVVDAYDASERAMGWFAYLENELDFPFTARCMQRRTISPLLTGDEVEVLSMAPAEECRHEVFVIIRWENDGLGVPLSQLEPRSAGRGTGVAIADWQYWVRQGYEF